MNTIRHKRAYKVWRNALNLILEEGREFIDEDDRTCKEISNMDLRIDSPSDNIREPIKRLNEFEKWIYPSLGEIEKNIISKETSLGYEYSYGDRIFAFSGDDKKKDQINEFIIPLLKENRRSRRAVVGIWNPLEDSNIFKKEIPGLVTLDFKMASGRLNVTGIIRSNDVFYGWPASIYQCFKIQEYVAEKLGEEIGFLSTFSTSAHIFEEQIEYIKKVIGEE